MPEQEQAVTAQGAARPLAGQSILYQQLPDRIPAPPQQVQLPDRIPSPASSLPDNLPSAGTIQQPITQLPKSRQPVVSGYQGSGPGIPQPVQVPMPQLPDRIPATSEGLPQFEPHQPIRNVDRLLPERLPAQTPGMPELPVQSLPGGGQMSATLPGTGQPPVYEQMILMLSQMSAKLDSVGRPNGQQQQRPVSQPLRMPPVGRGFTGIPQEGYAASSPSENVSSWGGLRGAGGWGYGTRHQGGAAQFLEPGRQDPTR